MSSFLVASFRSFAGTVLPDTGSLGGIVTTGHQGPASLGEIWCMLLRPVSNKKSVTC